MVSRMAVTQAIRAETTGDEQMDLLIFAALMPETQLAVLQEADTNKFIVDFVRGLKAAGVTAAAGSTAAAEPTHLPSTGFASAVGHPSILITSLAAYSMITYDIFGPTSLHVLQPVDQAFHHAVQASIDPELRRHLFGEVLSNWWIMAGSLGWIFTTATALSRYNPLAWQACALGWALWIFGVGPIEHDPALMEFLKTTFDRVRPSPVRRTPSFPSGHSAAAVLVVGALLFVLLPVVYGRRPAAGGRDAAAQGGGPDGAGGDNGGLGTVGGGAAGSHHPVLQAFYSVQGSWSLWALSALTTMLGRVGFDAHWLSDTLAGTALSVALVSGLANATERLSAAASSSSPSSSSGRAGL
ncbi:hypothetical protein VOLCADRAFT_106968 [Volvox carteri f. nagariensis]|uniref:Uncharacterized protein n=1 Tax=Volvox carteri f. nagariensis TaxID=3068 RepID=D8UB03_VOLCA|nr:uncharacterized protein VOLCADRAFT_106968 [Volvox carteri f. nagariensis]EFJ43084.1 hypothetical protein VOLCADRAFT_106968 [Volvox carteri f. nagariensis]|eukprot:XP_002955883.1 hypothetical protein VOLCADRAFT_106968 [Volvox carteri f. nagariensis]